MSNYIGELFAQWRPSAYRLPDPISLHDESKRYHVFLWSMYAT